MSVSKLLPATGSNDFNVAIGDTYTSVTFDKQYAAGAYTINATGSDTTYDIYAFNDVGTLAGYTNNASFTATIPFNKMVIIGQTTGVLLSFSYKKTYTSTTANNEVLAAPYILSSSSTTLPNANSTITVTGGNFATGLTGTFTSATTSTVYTASVTRTSATTASVGRPGTFPPAYNPYTLTLSNPGVTEPSGSNANKLVVNAGSIPTWTTGTTLGTRYTKNVSYSTTVVASDPDGGTITYSSVGAMPGGLTVNSTSGVISGTATSSTTLTFTIRATDQGGNTADRTFTLLNALPVWVTTSINTGTENTTANVQLSATDDGTISYSLASGSLPSGVSLSTSGLLSGTITAAGTFSFTITATDDAGGTANQSFSWVINPSINFLVAAGGGGGGGGYANPSNRQGGGGGAGGLRTSFGSTSGRGSSAESPVAITTGTQYSVSIGAGGGVGGGQGSMGGNGGGSTFHTISTTGGGGGGYSTNGTGNSGGCGGGGGSIGGAGGAGTANQGYDGSAAIGSNAGGPGGGAGAPISGTTDPSGSQFTSSITGSSYAYCKGGYGASGNFNTNYGDGGCGTYEGANGDGGKTGVVILRYSASLTCNIGGGLSGSTTNLGNGYKVTTITSGSGNVSWS